MAEEDVQQTTNIGIGTVGVAGATAALGSISNLVKEITGLSANPLAAAGAGYYAFEKMQKAAERMASNAKDIASPLRSVAEYVATMNPLWAAGVAVVGSAFANMYKQSEQAKASMREMLPLTSSIISPRDLGKWETDIRYQWREETADNIIQTTKAVADYNREFDFGQTRKDVEMWTIPAQVYGVNLSRITEMMGSFGKSFADAAGMSVNLNYSLGKNKMSISEFAPLVIQSALNNRMYGVSFDDTARSILAYSDALKTAGDEADEYSISIEDVKKNMEAAYGLSHKEGREGLKARAIFGMQTKDVFDKLPEDVQKDLNDFSQKRVGKNWKQLGMEEQSGIMRDMPPELTTKMQAYTIRSMSPVLSRYASGTSTASDWGNLDREFIKMGIYTGLPETEIRRMLLQGGSSDLGRVTAGGKGLQQAPISGDMARMYMRSDVSRVMATPFYAWDSISRNLTSDAPNIKSMLLQEKWGRSMGESEKLSIGQYKQFSYPGSSYGEAKVGKVLIGFTGVAEHLFTVLLGGMGSGQSTYEESK